MPGIRPRVGRENLTIQKYAFCFNFFFIIIIIITIVNGNVRWYKYLSIVKLRLIFNWIIVNKYTKYVWGCGMSREPREP